MLGAIIIGVVMAVFAPFIAFATSKYIARGQRERAFARLTGDPFVKVGARISRLHTAGVEAPVLSDCVLTKIGVGYVVIQSADGKLATTFTGQEFEKLTPIWITRKTISSTVTGAGAGQFTVTGKMSIFGKIKHRRGKDRPRHRQDGQEGS